MLPTSIGVREGLEALRVGRNVQIGRKWTSRREIGSMERADVITKERKKGKSDTAHEYSGNRPSSPASPNGNFRHWLVAISQVGKARDTRHLRRTKPLAQVTSCHLPVVSAGNWRKAAWRPRN